ncbi:hypothetical protein ACFV4Q_38215 [Streptomyces nojiriensis]|uniref:hypothetical protein n=1 Tax=Streptomyces nojiriensis TaxID=66374 RepID=UPI00364C2A01
MRFSNSFETLLNGRHLPGYRGWTKIRRRDTTEMIVGAVIGTLTRPQLLVLGRHDTDGRLRPVGRTVRLRADAARQVPTACTVAASLLWRRRLFRRPGPLP